MSGAKQEERIELRCKADKALLGVSTNVPSGEVVLRCRRCKKNRLFRFPRKGRQEPSPEPKSDEEPIPGK
ncbi:MAG TPA: hypothetical protein VE262_21850 [Blastocatellia bacterium]|nr:hypothetical protein [Blastocatellia bacterium]